MGAAFQPRPHAGAEGGNGAAAHQQRDQAAEHAGGDDDPAGDLLLHGGQGAGGEGAEEAGTGKHQVAHQHPGEQRMKRPPRADGDHDDHRRGQQ